MKIARRITKAFTANSLLGLMALSSACAAEPISEGTAPAPARAEAPKGGMVAAAHPLAAEAGAEALRKGGNAIDAALATAFMLNVVEPQASGLGGGGFLVYWDNKTGESWGLDYRETAPAALDPTIYFGDKKNARKLRETGTAIATPGTLRGLMEAHRRAGRLPLATLLEPAIAAARNGVPASREFARRSGDQLDKISSYEATSAIFLEDNILPRDEGALVVQTDLATTLELVAAHGEDAIYKGEMPERIAAAARAAGSVMQASDIEDYKVRPLTLTRGTFRGYDLIVPSSPGVGGTKLLATLGLYERSVPATVASDVTTAVGFAEACSMVFPVVENEMGDYPFTADAGPSILKRMAANHLEWTPAHISVPVATGQPGVGTVSQAKVDSGNTTHLSVIDADGNMVALTQTLNYFFGSGVTVPGTGILLNNEMADFEPAPGVPNSPAPGKRPKSNMCPMFIVRDGKAIATLGTPGGDRISSAMGTIVLSLLEQGKGMKDAIESPRVHFEWEKLTLHYEGTDPADPRVGALTALSSDMTWKVHPWQGIDSYFGGAQGILIHQNADGTTSLEGAADSRRDGAVRTP